MRVDMPLAAAEPFVSDRLLAWYDRHARALPWRSPPGVPPPNPYRVWLSEVMLQQTTVAAVKPYFARFTARWPTVEALAAADEAELMSAWAGLGYYARARNLLACAREVTKRGGFPENEAELIKLPGIGRYTAAAIAAIAFGRRTVVVDGNVERVVARLFAIETPLPAAKVELYRLTDLITPTERPGDFAQAMMDLGATICAPKAPACALCPLRGSCRAQALGRQEAFPVRAAKKARPRRFGTAFWLERDGHVLLVRRPERGLLGGMRALPTGEWASDAPGLEGAPADAEWRVLDASVSHVFTHFALELALAAARAESDCKLIAAGEWWPVEQLGEAGLPTVFAKAVRKFIGEASG